MEKFCYLGDMIGCYAGVSEVVSTRIGSVWNTFGELSVLLARKHVFGALVSLEQGTIYQCCARPVLF